MSSGGGLGSGGLGCGVLLEEETIRPLEIVWDHQGRVSREERKLRAEPGRRKAEDSQENTCSLNTVGDTSGQGGWPAAGRACSRGPSGSSVSPDSHRRAGTLRLLTQ